MLSAYHHIIPRPPAPQGEGLTTLQSGDSDSAVYLPHRTMHVNAVGTLQYPVCHALPYAMSITLYTIYFLYFIAKAICCPAALSTSYMLPTHHRIAHTPPHPAMLLCMTLTRPSSNNLAFSTTTTERQRFC